MKMKRIAIAGIVALALTSLGGVAFAKVSAHQQSTPATSSETTTGVDTDNVQDGDQTSLDTGSEDVATGEAGSGSGESDGPGGHEDPAGNVDHQFDGQE
jgi:hypothetical protein